MLIYARSVLCASCVQVLISRYPQLTVVANRLLDIYCQLTGDRHSELDTHSPEETRQHSFEDKTCPLEGRALSLR